MAADRTVNTLAVKRRKTILLLLLASSAGHADGSAEELISRCATNPEKDQRIACLEDELRRLAADEVPVLSSAPVPAPSAAANEGAPPLPPKREEVEERQLRAASLGAEQVERRGPSRSPADSPVRATVVAVDEVGYRRLVVELDNGQVWRQTNGDRTNVIRALKDDDNFDVELRRTGMGGYRMYITPLDRTIRVERLR